MTEKQFQAQVTTYAKLQGYRVYHSFDSRRCEPGFPDLTIVGKGRLIFAELKVSAPVTADQRWWLDELARAGAKAYLWTPSTWAEIEEVLGG